MILTVKQSQRGFSLSIQGNVWNADKCSLYFPKHIWEPFSSKAALINELAYVTTMATPMILQHNHVEYTSGEPQFISLYNDCFEDAVPNLIEEIPDHDYSEIIDRFHSINKIFHGKQSQFSININPNNKRVLLPFSFGKDSLLTLATLVHLGYEVIPIIIDERVLPRGFAIKEKMIKKFFTEFKIKTYIVVNEIQLLSDYEVLKMPATRLYQVQVYFIYILVMLPFCEYFNAPTIAINNEYANSLDFYHRNGIVAPRCVMQSYNVTKKLKRMLKKMTKSKIQLINPIRGLGDFAIHYLLYTNFFTFVKFRISCHMELTKYKSWCHDCVRCAHAYLYLSAIGYDIKELQFKQDLLLPEYKHLYYVFSGFSNKDKYKNFVKTEELIAFSLLRLREKMHPLVKEYIKNYSKANRIKGMIKRILIIHRGYKHIIEKKTHFFYYKELKKFEEQLNRLLII